MIKTITVIVVAVLLVTFAFGFTIYDGMGMLLNSYSNYPVPAINVGVQTNTTITAGVNLYALYPDVVQSLNQLPIRNEWIITGNVGLQQDNFALLADFGYSTYPPVQDINGAYIAGLTTIYKFAYGSVFQPSISFSMLFPFTMQNVYYPTMILSFQNFVDLF
jgi:hypothetical protein